MTSHKIQEERIQEILDAALEVIDNNGYTKLTMEAIVAKSPLSKGGVYRFFANKRDVALALYRRILWEYGKVNVEEALEWGLPLKDTLFNLLFRWANFGPQMQRDFRVWLQLLPETLWDEAFSAERDRQVQVHQDQYKRLISEVIRRDGITVRVGFEARLETTLSLATAFMQGMALVILAGVPQEKIVEQIKHFIEVMLSDALE